MSDFQDFLKHQYASVSIASFKPGKFAEVRHLYEQAVSGYQQGFKGAYLLQEPGSDQGLSIIFWDSLEDMEANQTQEHQKLLQKMTPFFEDMPDVKLYELVCEIQPGRPDTP